VSTPVTWDEVGGCAEGETLSFVAGEVLARIDELGDLFGPTSTLEQELPAPQGS
jgi:bifunctional non-homologous end joining protein LigD